MALHSNHQSRSMTHTIRSTAPSGPRLVLTLSIFALGIQAAYADGGTMPVEFAPVSVTVQSGAYGTAAKGTASAIAPTQASLRQSS